VHSIVHALHSFSLVSVTSIGGALFLQLHPLVQAWSHDMAHSSHHFKEMAIQTLTCCYGEKAFLLYQHILPHLLEILGQAGVQYLHVNTLMPASDILYDQGHYHRAAELLEIALEKTRKSGYESTLELRVTEKLAHAYQGEEKWKEAEKLYLEVLEQRRSQLGMKHPDAIEAAAHLASTYYSQGR